MITLTRLLQRFALWLVLDSGIRLGKLAPHVFGFGIGRTGRRIK